MINTKVRPGDVLVKLGMVRFMIAVEHKFGATGPVTLTYITDDGAIIDNTIWSEHVISSWSLMRYDGG